MAIGPLEVGSTRRRKFDTVARVELGTKRQCASCGAKFYDLRRDPIICPRCEVVFEPVAAPWSRVTAARAAAETSPVVAARDVEIVIAGKNAKSTDDADAADVVAEDDDTDDLIEDVSELGEDDDVVADAVAAAPKDDDER